MVVDLNTKNFKKERKVLKPLYKLTKQKKVELLRAPIADVLDVAFLRCVGLQRSDAALQNASNTIGLLFSGLGIESLKGLQHLSLKDLSILPRLGNRSLAVLLDLLQAFDIPLAEKSFYKQQKQGNGKVLASRLGLKN